MSLRGRARAFLASGCVRLAASGHPAPGWGERMRAEWGRMPAMGPAGGRTRGGPTLIGESPGSGGLVADWRGLSLTDARASCVIGRAARLRTSSAWESVWAITLLA